MLVFYLHYEAPDDEKNFPMVMEMLRAADVREDDDSYQSPLDELFERLEMKNPDHIAVKHYKDYHSGRPQKLSNPFKSHWRQDLKNSIRPLWGSDRRRRIGFAVAGREKGCPVCADSR